MNFNAVSSIPPWTQEIKNVRDVQFLLARGYEFEADFAGLQDLVSPDSCYAIDVKNPETGEIYEYVADDLNEFGRDAMFGPYPLADVIGNWEIWLARLTIRRTFPRGKRVK